MLSYFQCYFKRVRKKHYLMKDRQAVNHVLKRFILSRRFNDRSGDHSPRFLPLN